MKTFPNISHEKKFSIFLSRLALMLDPTSQWREVKNGTEHFSIFVHKAFYTENENVIGTKEKEKKTGECRASFIKAHSNERRCEGRKFVE